MATKKKATAKKKPEAAKKGETPSQDKQDRSTAQKMKARAIELHKGIVSRQVQNRRGPLEDGWDAAEMKRGNLWVYLGYDDETGYRKGVGIGRSTWFRYRRLAEGLCKLPKEEFLKLRAENADHLVALPEARRYDKELVKKAQTMIEEEFEKYVVKFQAQKDRIEEGDVIVTLKWRMPEARRQVIMDTLKEFARKHDMSMDDESRILELALAEVRHREPIVTKVSFAMQDLYRAHKLLTGESGEMSLEDVNKKAGDIVGSVIRGIAAAAGIKIEMLQPKAVAVNG